MAYEFNAMDGTTGAVRVPVDAEGNQRRLLAAFYSASVSEDDNERIIGNAAPLKVKGMKVMIMVLCFKETSFRSVSKRKARETIKLQEMESSKRSRLVYLVM